MLTCSLKERDAQSKLYINSGREYLLAETCRLDTDYTIRLFHGTLEQKRFVLEEEACNEACNSVTSRCAEYNEPCHFDIFRTKSSVLKLACQFTAAKQAVKKLAARGIICLCSYTELFGLHSLPRHLGSCILPS